MTGTAPSLGPDLLAWLDGQRARTLLRFITCGSVDDGKSTLIGRLLYESKALHVDQLATLEADSRRHGTQGEALDFALLVDGLAAEREQGITIDVAYRFFSTARRSFIVADTPGHEQYTRNMATGASTAEAAVILVDARKGLLPQTRRHSHIMALMGIRHVALAVNKMDLMGHDRGVFEAIEADYCRFAAAIGLPSPCCIPLSALCGDNLVERSVRMPWFAGPTLMDWLESIELDAGACMRQPLRFPVQWVNRPDAEFRGYAGTVASGSVRPGDAVRVLPSGRTTRIARIVTRGGDLPRAVAGQSVTLTLAEALDVSRGDWIAAAEASPDVADQFEASLVWMDEAPLLPGRPYWLKIGTQTVGASVTTLKHRVDVDTGEPLAAAQLAMNEIGVGTLALQRPVPFEPYRAHRSLGSFILIDRITQRTAGAGMLHFALRRAHNIHWQATDVDRTARAALLRQRPCLLWFTGLSGAGKSTIANRVERLLHARGHLTYLLDGDNLRHGLNRDLGFTDADRVENIRRAAEVGRLMVDAGLIVLASFISPFRAERRLARSLLPDGAFLEIHVDAPLEVAEARDPKGLYRKARRGELRHFTGIDSPYEAPEQAELRLDTARLGADEAAEAVVALLAGRGMLAQGAGLDAGATVRR